MEPCALFRLGRQSLFRQRLEFIHTLFDLDEPFQISEGV